MIFQTFNLINNTMTSAMQAVAQSKRIKGEEDTAIRRIEHEKILRDLGLKAKQEETITKQMISMQEEANIREIAKYVGIGVCAAAVIILIKYY